jgi:signal transduction histidine kinase
MDIRKKLTVRFIIIVAIIITLSTFSIYFSSSEYRKDDFYKRLNSKAINTAKLLIEVEEVDADLLKKIETDNPVSLPNERIIIFNYKNEILYSSDEGSEFEIDATLLDNIRLEKEIFFEQGNYEVIGFLYADQYDRFVIIAGATDIYGLNKLKNLRTILLISFIASILVVSIAGWVYSGKALQPISKVVKQVDAISIASLDSRVDEGNGTDEIAQLAKTFNRMLMRLEKAFNLQKNFIANASHELRTPLTIITGQLEVALLSERNSEDYKKVVQNTLSDIVNLNATSNRLLLLAQASSDSTKKGMLAVRMDEVLWQAKEDITKRHPIYEIKFHFDPNLDDDEKLTVLGDEQLLKTAVTNIIDNGCKYSPNHVVEVRIKSIRSKLVMEFQDNGIGIDQEDLRLITEPFHRGKNTGQIKGHGIGLSLVDRIISLHNGTLSIQSTLNVGTQVVIQLPIKKAKIN